MSTIWAAEDRQLHRSVAVKLLSMSMAERHGARRRFEREAMAVARLQSPNIVQVFDYGVEDDRPVIVMELLHGEDLRQRLKGRVKLPLPAVIEVVKQCARGLGEAHSAGIIHRDLKPANIYLARDRQRGLVVKILDFGVAKADGMEGTGKTTKAGDILGTPHYMSPEQARAKEPVDHRTDLWSIGVIAYRMLCGRVPFLGHNTAQILIAAATEGFHPPTTYVPELPPEIDDFMSRALARDREQRFSSAAEMVTALEEIWQICKARGIRDDNSVDELTTVAAPGTVRMASPMRGAVVVVDEPTADAPLHPPLPHQPPHQAAQEPPSEPPMPSHPSSFPAPTDPSHGSLGIAFLSAPPPAQQQSAPRSIPTIIAAAVLLGLVSVAGAVVWSSQQPAEAPAPSPAATEPAPTAEAPRALPSASAPDAAPSQTAAESAPTASASASSDTASSDTAASAAPSATAATTPLPKPVAGPRRPPQRLPPKRIPRPPPRKPGPDPYGSRF
jgi:serine/threonine-protein kinase